MTETRAGTLFLLAVALLLAPSATAASVDAPSPSTSLPCVWVDATTTPPGFRVLDDCWLFDGLP